MNTENYTDAHKIELNCVGCGHSVEFSLLDLNPETKLVCKECGKTYAFTPELADQIKRFSELLSTVYACRDLLGQASIGVKVKDKEITVPYQLLLTRLNSLLSLKVNDQEMTFRFRVDPTAIFDKKTE
ncbi:hypothetical protein IKW72_03260 [bacterium]|nr:hypothetical protein [bacterium]